MIRNNIRTRATACTMAVLGAMGLLSLSPQSSVSHGNHYASLVSVKGRADGEVKYRVTEIPLPYEVASGERLVINAAGDVAGTHEQHKAPDDKPVAFYYHKGVVTYLADNDGETHAVALNNRGQVLLGRATVAEGGVREPFLWEKGHFKSLGQMPTVIPDWHTPFGEKKVAFAVGSALNDAGEVAGYFVADIRGSDLPLYARTFLWKKDKVTLLNQDLPKPSTFGANLADVQNAACMFVSAVLNRKGELIGYTNGGGFTERELPFHRVRMEERENADD